MRLDVAVTGFVERLLPVDLILQRGPEGRKGIAWSRLVRTGCRRPAAAERLEQADDREHAIEPIDGEQILRGEQSLLGLQQRHEVERAGLELLLRQFEGAARAP